MKDSNYIKIFTGNFILVNRIAVALQEVGIDPIIKDESESGRLAGFGASIQGEQELFVHKDAFEKASSIIEGIKKELRL